MTGVGQQDIVERLAGLGYRRPAPAPTNRFAGARVHRSGLCFVSSVTPVMPEGEMHGVIGVDVTEDQAIAASAWCAANSLWLLGDAISRDHLTVENVIDVLVFVNCPAGYGRHSLVADGASDLFHAVFETNEGHTRGAVGAGSLVRNSVVVVKATYSVA